MKKVFEELDGLIPRSLLDRWPEKRKLIRKIDKIENLIDEYCSNKRRALLYQNCEGNQKQKLLRIYLDHKYANQTSEEKGHYLLTIQGRLIDSAIYQHFSFGLFFDSIKVVLDKKHNPNNCVYEWNKSAFATGSQSNCFRFKIFSENRHLPIKIILQRSAYSKQRYEVSAELRSLFPQIRQDPTEDEVMDALFQYITTNQLLEAKEKAAVKCDQALQAALGPSEAYTNTAPMQPMHVPVHSLRQRVVDRLRPCHPIVVEHVMHAGGGEESKQRHKESEHLDRDKDKDRDKDRWPEFAHTLSSSENRKNFDLEVQVEDEGCDTLVAWSSLASFPGGGGDAGTDNEGLAKEIEAMKRAKFLVGGMRASCLLQQHQQRLPWAPPPARKDGSAIMSGASASQYSEFVLDPLRAIKMRRAQGKDPFLAVDVTCAAPYLNVVQKFCKAGDIYLDVADDEFFNSSSKMLAACADATVGHAAGQSAQAVQSTQVVSR